MTSDSKKPLTSHDAIDPNELPDFANMPNVALMDTSNVDKSQPPFVLVDGSYYLFRTYHALPEMTNSAGLHTNAVKGTLNALNKLIRRYQPTHMAVAFDTKSPTFRHAMSEAYKANRPPMDKELVQQIPYVHKVVEALGIPLIRIEGAEADDIIGTLAERACKQGHHVVISTGDKDMAQLVNDAVVLEDSFKGQITDVDGVLEKFEVKPEQIIDYLTLMGDASDGIKGVPKVGKKTAVKLLNEYGDLDGILANAPNIKGVVGKNLVEYADNTARDKQLATIITNMNIGLDWDTLKIDTNQEARSDELRALYTELEFKNELSSLNHPNHPANIQRAQNQNASQPAPAVAQTAVVKDWRTILDKQSFESLLSTLEAAPYFAFDTETSDLNWRHAEIVGVSFAVPIIPQASTPQISENQDSASAQRTAYYIPLAHALPKKGETPSLDLGLDPDTTASDSNSDNSQNNSKDKSTSNGDELISKQLNREYVLSKLKPILENPEKGVIGQHLKYDEHVLSNYDISIANWHCDTMLASYVLNAAATRHGMDALAKHYLGKETIKFEDVAGKGAKQVTFDKVAIDVASDYACEDADITLELFEVFNKKFTTDDQTDGNNLRILNNLEIPTAQLLTKMEATGILIDRAFLMELSVRFDEEIIALEKQAYDMVGEQFNLGSPKQLGVILFEKMGIEGGKKTKSGQYSTSEAVLSKIDHPLIDIILEYRSLSKLKSTYTDALARVADARTDRVHTSYHQALTSTGRLSSTEPNLQNIPIRTATGRLIRQAFIAPSAHPNAHSNQKRIIMAADYSQIELRLMAHFSGDEALINAFNQGLDIHSATAADVLGKNITEVTKEERRNAKAINFGLLYGMSQFGLAKQLGLSRKEAQDYINLYFARYPKVKDYMQDTRTCAYDNGYVNTVLGRRLYTPDIQSSNRMVKQGAERAAINAPLQGSAADIIKLAMIAVDKALTEQGLHHYADMLLQVHDELVFEVDSDKVDEVAEVIKAAMENVFTITAQALGWHVEFSVPLLVEVDKGTNWDEAH